MIEVIIALIYFCSLGLVVGVIGPLLEEAVDLAIEAVYNFVMACDFIQIAGFLSGSS